MTAPLAVKLTTPDGVERMITRDIADLRFSEEVRGGYASAEAPLAQQLDLPGVPAGSRLTVYDSRTAATAWDGRILTPGRGTSSSGQVASVKAVGEGFASTKDQRRPYMVIDSDLSSWTEQTSSRTAMSLRNSPSPNTEVPGLTFSGRGPVVNGDRTIAWNQNLYRCRQKIGAIGFTHVEGANGTHQVDLRLGDTPLAVSAVIASFTWSTTLSTRFYTFTDAARPDATTPKIGWRFAASVTVDEAVAWGTMRTATVYARLLGRNRQSLPTSAPAYTSGLWVRIEDVFIDAIARFCPRLDIENARVDAGTFDFTQLVWTSGISVDQVLDEVLDMEPDMTWGVYERRPNGRYRTELRKLPTEVRYEASAVDGWTSPNASTEIYNQVYVKWVDNYGLDQTTVVTAPVPALTAAGLVRSATIDLGSEMGTEAAAVKRGTAFLADHRVPPSGGTLTVSRPIRDLFEGRYVMPWEIKAGELVRLIDVYSPPGALGARAADGKTVSRIVERDFTLSSMSARLQLDVPPVTEKRLLADLATARSRG